jgi:hypothetical protein
MPNEGSVLTPSTAGCKYSAAVTGASTEGGLEVNTHGTMSPLMSYRQNAGGKNYNISNRSYM